MPKTTSKNAEEAEIASLMQDAKGTDVKWLAKHMKGPVIALLDTSGSMDPHIFAAQRLAVKAAIDTSDAKGQFYLRTFSDRIGDPVSAQDGGAAVGKVVNDARKNLGGGTEIEDVLAVAQTDISARRQTGQDGETWTVLLITDDQGAVNIRTETVESFREKMKEKNIRLVTVAFGENSDKSLKDISNVYFRVQGRDSSYIDVLEGPLDMESLMASLKERVGDGRGAQAALKAAAAVGEMPKEEGGGIDQDRQMHAMQRLIALYGKFNNEEAFAGMCETISRYHGHTAGAVMDGVLGIMGNIGRSSMSAWMVPQPVPGLVEGGEGAKDSQREMFRLFVNDVLNSEAMANCMEKYGGSYASKLIVQSVFKRAEEGMFGGLFYSYRFDKEMDYVKRLLTRISSEGPVRVLTGHGKEYTDAAYNAVYKLGMRQDTSAPLEEFCEMIGKFDPDTAGKVADRFKDAYVGVIDRAGQGNGSAGLPEDKASSIIRFFGRTGKLMADYDISAETVGTILSEGLDRVIEDRKGFEAVHLYIDSRGALPKPTAANIGDYESAVRSYMKEKWGLEKDLSMQQISLLLSWAGNGGGYGWHAGTSAVMGLGMVQLINRASEDGTKYYSVSVGGKAVVVDYQKDLLTRYAVTALTGVGDKDHDAEGVLARIVGEKAVKRGRNSFNSKHKGMRQEIINAVKASDYARAADILRGAGDPEVTLVLDAANYKEAAVENGRLIRASESKNPLDYDGRTQIACVYMPNGDGIFGYCVDDRVTLVKYEIGGKSVGSAICYMEDGKFLVDSVEGHRTFRKQETFGAVYDDLLARAMAKGATQMVFNRNTPNETAMGFLKFLESMGLNKETVEMKLDTSSYIEARKGGVNAFTVRLREEGKQAEALLRNGQEGAGPAAGA